MLGRERYYVDKDRGHDYLLRCKDCGALVPFVKIQQYGCCPGTAGKACGNKRFAEITALAEQEMADIRSGVIDFEDRALFLEEFEAVPES